MLGLGKKFEIFINPIARFLVEVGERKFLLDSVSYGKDKLRESWLLE